MNIGDRIKKIRKERGKSQEEFGKIIGIGKTSVSKLENGENNPSDQTIILICKEFSINKDWLRYGTGEMSQKLTKNQEISAFANEVMELPDEAFKKRFIDALKKLDEKDWKHLEEIANKLLKEG